MSAAHTGERLGLPAPMMLDATANPAIWNHTGQPAAALPVEAAADGFPVRVQLVGRPGSATGRLDPRPPLAA